ncbi:carbon-nitrogen hydrolase family protein [bacterium]|nr:carbon-nitrogen hydrolase family protein [bacterium]
MINQTTPKARNVFRIGAYQGPTQPAAFAVSARRTLAVLAAAYRRRVDFACLPECFLTGGCLTTDELRAGAVAVRSEAFRRFVRQCAFGDMVSIVGFTEKRGRHLHNSAAVIHRGQLVGVHRKSVPGGLYDKEANTFVSDFRVFRRRGVIFGVIICFEGFFIEPALLTAEQGARIIFEPHHSFIPMQGMDWQRQRVRTSRAARAVENDCWYVKANVAVEPMRKVAGAAGFGYGDSFILDNIGRPQAEAGLFTTGWITADVPRKELTAKRESRVGLAPRETRRQIVRLYRAR